MSKGDVRFTVTGHSETWSTNGSRVTEIALEEKNSARDVIDIAVSAPPKPIDLASPKSVKEDPRHGTY